MGNPTSYVYGIQSGLFIKIGVAGNIKARLETMNLYNPHPCKVVARRVTEYAYLVEKRVHKILEPYAIGREWFMVDAKLVRAALTIAIRDVCQEQTAYQIEMAARAEQKRNRKLGVGGRDVESETAKS